MVIASAIAMALLSQTPAASSSVVDSDQPATASVPLADDIYADRNWVIEYPVIMQPMVDEYRRCLNYADRRFRRKADFEAQYEADIPRCEKTKTRLIEQSQEALSMGRWSEVLAPEKAADVYRTLGEIHVERGRAFDDQLLAIYRVREAREINTDLGTFEQEPNATDQ